jgi:hypothetical protein
VRKVQDLGNIFHSTYCTAYLEMLLLLQNITDLKMPIDKKHVDPLYRQKLLVHAYG